MFIIFYQQKVKQNNGFLLKEIILNFFELSYLTLIQNFKTKFFIFEYFPKFLQKWTHHTLFTLFILIPNSSYEKFSFCIRGVPGGPTTKNWWYLKIISTRVCKKNFLFKAKKIFCTRCPKSAVREGKTKFKKKSQGICKKYWVRSQIFRHGWPEDFLSKGQKG